MLKQTKKQEGITLIALVITVIVLLILAAVTINALNGDNGILKRASEAKKGTNQSTVEEITKLSINGLITDNLGDTSTITPQVLANRINKDYNRTDVTAEDSAFPTNMIFAKEKLSVPVDIKLTVGTAEKSDDDSGIYAGDIDESKIAPAELFNYEPIKTGSNNKIASTGDMSSLPLKEAKITGIKPQYCNKDGYNPKTDKNDFEDTNYEIKYEGISDTLIIPYQVEFNGEMYKVTEVNLTVKESDYSFLTLPSIENIIYPNTVKVIEGADYNGNEKLKNIVLPKNIKEIPSSFFNSCNNLVSIDIPKGVTSIQWGTFNECSKLESVNIQKGVTSIGDYAFYKCYSLKNIEMPDDLTEIGEYAFKYCKGLTSIRIPDKVSKIAGQTFYGCDNLTSIILPDNITEIDDIAFCNCTKLASVTYKGNTYESKAELQRALSDEGVKLGDDLFKNTVLEKNDPT